MGFAIAFLGVCIALLGVVGVVSPPRLFAMVERMQSRSGLYLIAGLRLLFGAMLIATAPASRAPGYLLVLGVVAVVSGLVTPFLGLGRFEALLRWWRSRPDPAVRIWCAIVALFGLSLVWAALPWPGTG
jgi:hypothetical protein